MGLGDGEEGSLPAVERFVHHVLEAGDTSAFWTGSTELGTRFGSFAGFLLGVCVGQ
jgi:hypothetical protein